jgi:tellurite methyltransferase
MNLSATFGDIDIYLFDQLLRGRLLPGMRVLDAGCGGGRNLVYLLQSGFEVYGCDSDPQAVESCQALVRSLAPQMSAENIRLEPVEHLSFESGYFDAVLSSAVLHFARDEQHFLSMLREMWRVVRSGGIFFCRLASSVALQHQHVSGRRFLSPDGIERFLVDESFLTELTRSFGAELLDPIKTTVIQNARCMTTWVIRKPYFHTRTSLSVFR